MLLNRRLLTQARRSISTLSNNKHIVRSPYTHQIFNLANGPVRIPKRLLALSIPPPDRCTTFSNWNDHISPTNSRFLHRKPPFPRNLTVCPQGTRPQRSRCLSTSPSFRLRSRHHISTFERERRRWWRRRSKWSRGCRRWRARRMGPFERQSITTRLRAHSMAGGYLRKPSGQQPRRTWGAQWRIPTKWNI